MSTFTRPLCLVGALLVLGPLHGGQKAAVDVRGTIKKVTPAPKASEKSEVLGLLLVEGPRDPKVAHDKASVRVTVATKIFQKLGTERKPAMFSDLKEGQQIEATFVGPVGESYPVQAAAREIVILPGPAKK